MRTYSLSDQQAPLDRLWAAIRSLQTATPAESASIQRGRTRVLNAAGDPLAALGHLDGKSGILIRVGSEWRTVQEHIESRVSAGTGFLANRIGDVEGRMTSAEAGITYTANRVGDVEGRMGGAEARLTSAEAGITYTANRTTGIEGRMSNAETSLNDKASQADMTAVKQKINQVLGMVKQLDTQVTGFHSGKAPLNPVSPIS